MPRARADLERLVALRSVANPQIEPVEECRPRPRSWPASSPTWGWARSSRCRRPTGPSRSSGARPGRTPPRRSCSTRTTTWSRRGEPGEWDSPPWQLTERAGRWYGRGAADCKGNLVATLLALQALREVCGGWPVEVAVVCEGSEEQSSGGMEALARRVPTSSAATRSCSPTPATSRWASPRSPPRCAGPGACWSPCAPWTARPTPGCTAGPRRTRCRLCSRPWRACATRPARRRSTGWPTTAGGPARHTTQPGSPTMSACSTASSRSAATARPSPTSCGRVPPPRSLPSTASRSPR